MTTIDQIEISQLKLPLHVPYRVSSRTYTAFEPILIRIRTVDGQEGFGEAFLTPGYSTETPADAIDFCREHARSSVGRSIGVLFERLVSDLPRSPGAASAMLCAIEMIERVGLLQTLEPARIDLLAPCQATEPVAIREEVATLLEQGYRTFKVKVGFDVAADLARVAWIQEATAGRATLRLDANRAFSRADGSAFAAALEPQGIELFEQPCASADWDANAAVAKVSRVPVMLDESIYGVADIERAAGLQGVGYVKLKLKKIGSVAMLERALQRISELGLQPVLGDGVSTEIACWMEGCVARTTIRNAGEMNGFLKVKAELFREPLPFSGGALHLPAGYWPVLDERVVAEHSTFIERFDR